MAKKKLRLTVFSRFLLFMLIVVPGAYFGVSYYKGEDGLKNLKEMIGLETEASDNYDASTKTYPSSDAGDSEEMAKLREENTSLRKELEDKTKELEEMKDLLKKLSNALEE